MTQNHYYNESSSDLSSGEEGCCNPLAPKSIFNKPTKGSSIACDKGSQMHYYRIWQNSLVLSKPYWAMYEQLIGSKSITNESSVKPNQPGDNHISSSPSSSSSSSSSEFDSEIDEEEELDPEYLKFIEITRKHQEERDRQKKLEKLSKPDVDEYYKDISQVNTLVEANLVEAPDINDIGRNKLLEDKLIKLYGSREAYENIRSIEMSINEIFKKKCQELSPQYWPAVPINPKPYLNKMCS